MFSIIFKTRSSHSPSPADTLLLRFFCVVLMHGFFFAYIAGTDYGHVLTTLHFRPDHSVATVVQVQILEDVLQEGEERFTVELTAFDLSVVLVNSITEVVMDDDDEGKFKFMYTMKLAHSPSLKDANINIMSYVRKGYITDSL